MSFTKIYTSKHQEIYFDEERDEQGGNFQQFFFKANEEDKAIQWFN